MEHSHCGVGFLASLQNLATHQNLQDGLEGLVNLEHRGGADQSGQFGDGAGVMTSIPYKLFNLADQTSAVAFLFGPKEETRFKNSLKIFEQTFNTFDLHIEKYREVPIRPEALDPKALTHCPRFIQAFIKRPSHCRTQSSFDEILYMAKQAVRTRQSEAGIKGEFFFASLSSRTIVYKALSTSVQLAQFYPDLQNPDFETSFVLFHRRFSTNTLPTWDKVQPFRLIAHNGEINTIEGNLTAAISRERALGLPIDHIVTHKGTSYTGNLNNMVEALKYRSSIPHLNEILAIMIPPANWDGRPKSDYFRFWSRAMEPWDGPALVTYSDGKRIGARLDRSGLRPCRWYRTGEHFYLSSEAGAFSILPSKIIEQGTLNAGRSVNIHMYNGSVSFQNPDEAEYYRDANFDSRLEPLPEFPLEIPKMKESEILANLFQLTSEELSRELIPMADSGKEAIGSMGDTATLATFSKLDRSLYDFFYQSFAQVTNPPLDYLREGLVVDNTVILGRKPNIFEPKELIPPHRAYSMEGPIMTSEQVNYLLHQQKRVKVRRLSILLNSNANEFEFSQAFEKLASEALAALNEGATVLILSDRDVVSQNFDNQLNEKLGPKIPLPALLCLRAVNIKLNQQGVRLKTSIILDSGEIRNSHQVAVAIGFGASAVCPYLAFYFAYHKASSPADGIKNLKKALTDGLQKIMAKRGIAVIRSYQGSQLFSIVGFNQDLLDKFFPKHEVVIGGIGLKELYERFKNVAKKLEAGQINSEQQSLFLYKEHAGGKLGETHSMTSKRSRELHQIIRNNSSSNDLPHDLPHDLPGESKKQWQAFSQDLNRELINVRDLFLLSSLPVSVDLVEPVESILKTFGTGAMSFGSISAEAQRDLFLAFKNIGGRSNSGEGGENPFYYSEGITATIKQLASARFGVTAEYLYLGEEVQIKIAQGAKPGEGGQLMGPKVSEDIAKARFSIPGISLISPPPHHDIYSIEDLKQLIFELKELKPGLKVSVKLVSGANIGAVALGVVKAGADAIHISGGSGGTGAATLLSMKHAGLPFELGLAEVHHLLSVVGLRSQVTLRVDGGLFTGLDVVKAALLGADHFDFGKVLLVAEGCIMARVCEKNTCPTGIATQDPKFKKLYKGRAIEVERLMRLIAGEVRQHLATLGLRSLSEAVGRTDLLLPKQFERSFHTSNFLKTEKEFERKSKPLDVGPSRQDLDAKKINEQMIERLHRGEYKQHYQITSRDRAVGARASGWIAEKIIEWRKSNLQAKANKPLQLPHLSIRFEGSAGQGFGVFTTQGMALHLEGEANDSVAKSMSGGELVIVPFAKLSETAKQRPMLVGNACLYGATGGKVFLAGGAGDRFGIRNSGAVAVVQFVGLNACEYMTGGKVIILESALPNLGAGMTGGELYIPEACVSSLHQDSVQVINLSVNDREFLQKTLDDFQTTTGVKKSWLSEKFFKVIPR